MEAKLQQFEKEDMSQASILRASFGDAAGESELLRSHGKDQDHDSVLTAGQAVYCSSLKN